MSTVAEDPALNGASRDRQHAVRENGTEPVPNVHGTSAVNGFLRALSALLVPMGGRARRQRRKIAQWTTSSSQFLASLTSAVDAARRADRHAADVPARASAWSLPTLLLVMATLTVGDYFGINAILRAANLPQRASFTLPLVISVTLLISAKVLAHWDLSSVTAEPDRAHRDVAHGSVPSSRAGSDTALDTPVDATRSHPPEGSGDARFDAYGENLRRLEALARPVRRRKRAVLRLVGPMMALAILGLFIGLGALGSGLAGGLGLNDGEHDDLLLLCAFAVIAAIVLMNVSAAFALAYGMYVPGAAEYRAAVRNAQVKWLYVRFLSATARPERRSRRLLENLRVIGERANLRAALGHHEGMRELLAESGNTSSYAKHLADRLDRQLTEQTPEAFHDRYEERLARLERHLATVDSLTVPTGDGAGDGHAAGAP